MDTGLSFQAFDRHAAAGPLAHTTHYLPAASQIQPD